MANVPSEKKIDIGDLTEVVTGSVQRALQEHTAEEPFALGRFIIGIIWEPIYSPKGAPGGGRTQT
jgi:hypothetical protein